MQWVQAKAMRPDLLLNGMRVVACGRVRLPPAEEPCGVLPCWTKVTVYLHVAAEPIVDPGGDVAAAGGYLCHFL